MVVTALVPGCHQLHQYQQEVLKEPESMGDCIRAVYRGMEGKQIFRFDGQIAERNVQKFAIDYTARLFVKEEGDTFPIERVQAALAQATRSGVNQKGSKGLLTIEDGAVTKASLQAFLDTHHYTGGWRKK